MSPESKALIAPAALTRPTRRSTLNPLDGALDSPTIDLTRQLTRRSSRSASSRCGRSCHSAAPSIHGSQVSALSYPGDTGSSGTSCLSLITCYGPLHFVIGRGHALCKVHHAMMPHRRPLMTRLPPLIRSSSGNPPLQTRSGQRPAGIYVPADLLIMPRTTSSIGKKHALGSKKGPAAPIPALKSHNLTPPVEQF